MEGRESDVDEGWRKEELVDFEDFTYTQAERATLLQISF
jgi:hypothetical protein